MKFDKEFIIKNNKMLFWRLGQMNSVKQKHFGDRGKHQPPTSRGIWCFPYPHYDFFFCYHQWEAHLPKKYDRHVIGSDKKFHQSFWDNMTDEESEQWWKERDEELEKIKKIFRPKKFWYGGPFYSHIPLIGEPDYNRWFLWDSPKEWANRAKKFIYHTTNIDGTIYRFDFSKDEFEIFIHNYK